MTPAEFGAELLATVGPYLIAILGALLSWAALAVANWVRQRVKNEQMQATLLRLNDEVWTIVREVEQTFVGAMKDADGKLSADNAGAASELALEKAKAYLGKPGLDALARAVEPENLTEFIAARIEAAVHEMKHGE